MTTFNYSTGEPIEAGDRIRYHGDEGLVEFVVTKRTGDPSIDWFVNRFPSGGVMITAKGFGSVFLRSTDIDEQLEFVSRQAGAD